MRAQRGRRIDTGAFSGAGHDGQRRADRARAARTIAVIIPIGQDAPGWDVIAKQARTTRMTVLAAVTDRASAELCAKTTAKGCTSS